MLDALTIDEDMALGPLHRQSTELAERAAALGVTNVVGLDWADVRVLELRELELKGEAPMVASEDRLIPSDAGQVPVRIYRPDGPAKAIALYLHGGGWCAGSVALSDPECRLLADRAQVTVVSVDYRLAPEYPFPAGLEDCWAALRWTGAELALSSRALVTVGSSAGANLAAALALRARAEGAPTIDLQVLLCPALDLSFDCRSCREELGGFWLSTSDMRELAAAYMHGGAVEPLAAPASEPDLRDLPRSLVVTAEHDVLRDEAEIFARRLSAAVPVRAVRFPGMLHGFYEYRGVLDAANSAWLLICREIDRVVRHRSLVTSCDPRGPQHSEGSAHST